jgi:RNA polymerase sigma-70 factor, ECF subfamily
MRAGIDIDLGVAFLRHRHDLAATAARVLCRRDDLDDLVQDVFVEALRGVHNLRHPAALRAWLTRVAVRAAQRRLARRRAWTLRYLEGEPLAEIAARCGCSVATVKRRLAEMQALLPSP